MLALTVRAFRLSLSFMLLAPLLAVAETEDFTYDAGITTRFPLPFPSGSVATTFTSYTGTAFPFAMGTFEVGTTGDFSIAVSGIGSGVGVFVAEGPFAPNDVADPVTPLANFLAGTQAPPTIPALTLQAGVQYTWLVVVSSGSGTGTLTVDGDGCIAFSPDVCAAPPEPPEPVDPAVPIPTLNPWALLLLAVGLVIAVGVVRRRKGGFRV